MDYIGVSDRDLKVAESGIPFAKHTQLFHVKP